MLKLWVRKYSQIYTDNFVYLNLWYLVRLERSTCLFESALYQHIFASSEGSGETDSLGICCSTMRQVLLDFSFTVKAAPHECVIRTGQP